MAKYKEGTNVKWNWGDGTASGKVKSIFEKRTTRRIDGTEVTREGSKDNPAYYIERGEGNNVLKLESEISKA